MLAPAASLLALMIEGCAVGGANTAPANPGSVAPEILILSPGSISVRVGASQQFTPSLTGKVLAWSVNSITGGSAAIGTINSNGIYTAPAAVPSPDTVTIEALDTSKPTLTGTSDVSLLNPAPQISSLSPAQIDVGPFTLIITGSNFVNGGSVSFGGTPLTATFVSSTQIRAGGTATEAEVGFVTIQVTNPNPGSMASNDFSAQVIADLPPPPPSVAVSANVADRFLQQTTFGPTPR